MSTCPMIRTWCLPRRRVAPEPTGPLDRATAGRYALPRLLIVDAQVHIWGADTPNRPWPPGRAHQAQKPYPVTKDLVLEGMKGAGVERVVLVPPSWEGDRNDLALEAARQHPDRFAVMGRLPLPSPENNSFADWKKQQGMFGVRLTFLREYDKKLLTDGSADWIWPVAERYGIPI